MIDGMAYELCEMTPRDVDHLSFRDLWVVLAAARRRDRDRWRHTLAVAQAVYNWGGPRGAKFRPEPLDAMYQRAFGTALRPISPDRVRAVLSPYSVKRDG